MLSWLLYWWCFNHEIEPVNLLFYAFLKTHSKMGKRWEIILPHLFQNFVTAVFLQNCSEFRYLSKLCSINSWCFELSSTTPITHHVNLSLAQHTQEKTDWKHRILFLLFPAEHYKHQKSSLNNSEFQICITSFIDILFISCKWSEVTSSLWHAVPENFVLSHWEHQSHLFLVMPCPQVSVCQFSAALIQVTLP